ncbi:MAG: ammonium transporter [Parvularculaceae bacterium]|nr:ammonium transporter [Parvularculaceae bacterium]
MKRIIAPIIFILTFAPGLAAAQEIAPPSETSLVVFNTLLLFFCGMVVMFMAAGFCMLEVGLVRSKNAASICLKNVAAYAVASMMVWLVGYHLIYGIEPGGFLGPFALWSPSDMDPVDKGVASGADFFFQLVFVATAASIVSGALAERVKLSAFILFTAALTGLIYPIVASWDWGKGYLEAAWRFSDFAGATIVHSTGGWAALAGALIIGPRRGKYSGRRVTPMPGSNIPLSTLGAFILWFGWFGFNAGSQLAVGSVGDAIAVSIIVVNTNMAAAGGVIAASVMTSLIYKRVDLTIILNGAIGGLVSITAEPAAAEIWQSVLIGAMGGVIVTVGVPMLDRLKIDDVVGAIPAHLFCGVWGTLIAAWTNPAVSLGGQIVGVAMVGLFAFGMSALIWILLRYSIGARVGPEQELLGLDRAELGLEAYPEFAAR